VLLSAQKRMSKQGTMVVRNVREAVMDVFEVTGFSDVLTIES
jgi:anti-sigma B factor antagonist